MKNTLILLLLIFLFGKSASANLILANPGNYTTFLSSLSAGDTLSLAAGVYTNNLTLNNLNGTAVLPVVIMGSETLYTTIFQAQACCNTISITQCGYLVIKNLQLDGMNEAVDAVKGEGTSGNFAHHITLEYLNIINYGNNQQIVGISTKCSAWDWVIRKNRIIGAGTGLYLGNSNGDKPFVNGLIEYNLVMNTIGYNMEIKHQTDSVRDDFAGTSINGNTTIRYNVFCKENNGATGSSARPNLLVGGFPLTGWGSTDFYQIYGNFFYQNPTEALFQGTGNIMLYENIFVNHFDPSGFRAVYITPQNGVQPQDIKIFHNSVWVNNSSGGIRLYNPDTSYNQYCYGNAVFASAAITNFSNAIDNITDSYSNSSTYVQSASTNLAQLDLYPLSGQLTGTLINDTLFQNYSNWDKDFNSTSYDWTYRGAYSGCCQNNGWHLQLDTMPDHPIVTTQVFEFQKNGREIKIFPNPFYSETFIQSNINFDDAILEIKNLSGITIVLLNHISGKLISVRCDEMKSGIYILNIKQKGEFIAAGRIMVLN